MVLNPKQFFHGTVTPLEIGGEVHPARKAGVEKFHKIGSDEHAHATTDESHAWDYASLAHDWTVNRLSKGPFPVPKVYEVEPMGEVETDTTPTANSTDVRSKHGFRVVSERQMPEHMGEPEDWRS